MVAPPPLLSSLLLLFVVLPPSFFRAAAAAANSNNSNNGNNGNNSNNSNNINNTKNFDGRRRFRSDPYDVLRVDRHCDQGEIRREYRKLCLRYHPDKKKKKRKGTTTTREERRGGGGRPPPDGDDEDFEFKEVQHAHSLVGTEEDRRNYDLLAARRRRIDSFSSSSRRRRANHAGRHGDVRRDDARRRRRRDADAADVFAPSTMHFAFGDGGGMTFRFSNDIRHDLFGARGRAYDAFGTTSAGTKAPRPRYVQEVTIPLDVLYAGDREVGLTLLRTSVFDRYRAAYRGGVLRHALLRAALAVLLAWLRSQGGINMPLSLALFVSMVHSRTPPPPSRTAYSAVLRRGCKSGTEVERSDGVSDVTFVLREGKHDTYTRVGDDLHAEVVVSPMQLRVGCTLSVPPLLSAGENSHRRNDEEEEEEGGGGGGGGPIRLTLGPNEVADGETVIVKSRGWPVSSGGGYGDLHVKVRCRAV